MWGKADGFILRIKEVWDSNVNGTLMFCIVKKMKAVKKVLKGLNKECYSDIEVKTEEAAMILNEIQKNIRDDLMNPILITKERAAMETLRELNKANYSFLQQKAKLKWTDEGDMNSAYFHASLKKRCIETLSFKLKTNEGIVCRCSSIQDAFLEYYQGLLGSKKDNENVRAAVLEYGKYCTEDHITILNKPVLYEEIKQMVFSIPIDKTPGPDGYSSGFFRDSWNVIGNDVVAAVRISLAQSNVKSINATNISRFLSVRDLPRSNNSDPLLAAMFIQGYIKNFVQ
ncbi:uncharacterized protein LOC141619942 [Silene latifolia]|uniref:uncharacterized protein LOC141619942 n=1 Tax=Silene latifolia TaxID=37657 RepID=UPI003D77E08E